MEGTQLEFAVGRAVLARQPPGGHATTPAMCLAEAIADPFAMGILTLLSGHICYSAGLLAPLLQLFSLMDLRNGNGRGGGRMNKLMELISTSWPPNWSLDLTP